MTDIDSDTYFDSLALNTGDTVTMSIALTGETSGTVVIIDETTGDSASAVISTAGGSCMSYVQWMVTSYYYDGDALADFGTVTFTNAQAGTTSGFDAGPGDSEAVLWGIEYNGQIYTSTTVSGEYTMEVTYV